jgi:hypothetical protein
MQSKPHLREGCGLPLARHVFGRRACLGAFGRRCLGDWVGWLDKSIRVTRHKGPRGLDRRHWRRSRDICRRGHHHIEGAGEVIKIRWSQHGLISLHRGLNAHCRHGWVHGKMCGWWHQKRSCFYRCSTFQRTTTSKTSSKRDVPNCSPTSSKQNFDAKSLHLSGTKISKSP